MDTWTIIDNKMKADSALHKRMDETKDLLYMKDFELMQFDNRTKRENVINVTGNRVASYGLRVIENLSAYKWQTVVEGDISKREAHTIEEFLNASLDQTNIYLSENFDDVPDLYSFWARHICNRGRIGSQWMSWIEKGEYKMHCVPLDMRWTPYVKNKWVAPIYFKKKVDMEEELEKYEEKAKSGGGKYFKVTLGDDVQARDFWVLKKGKVSNELWIDKKLAYTQDYPLLKKLPFVIVVAPSGFMFRDKGYGEHTGEDIYFLIRKLEKELNRSLSIEATLGMDILSPALQQPRKVFTGQPTEPVSLSGEAVSVREGEEFKLMPRGEMNNASFAYRQDLVRQIDEGAPMQPRAYTQPPSAIEVATEVELLNQLYNSRVTALQMGLSQLYRLMVDMWVNLKGEIKVGGKGGKKHFSVVQLKDPDNYSISCRLMGKNTKLDIINESRALALWGKVPMKYLLEDILHVEDPNGWMRELALQKAKEFDPVIDLSEMGVRYAEEAEDIDDETEKRLKIFQSKRLIQKAVRLLNQETIPQRLPEPDKGNANALIALTGQAARGGALPKQSEEITQ